MTSEEKARVTALGLTVLAILHTLDESAAENALSNLLRQQELALASPTADEDYRSSLVKQLTFFTMTLRRVAQGFPEDE